MKIVEESHGFKPKVLRFFAVSLGIGLLIAVFVTWFVEGRLFSALTAIVVISFCALLSALEDKKINLACNKSVAE